MSSPTNISFVFFGTSEFSVAVLETLSTRGFFPTLIVTTPESKQGRGLELIPSPAKMWAQTHNISFIEPTTLKSEEIEEKLRAVKADTFVVASYGKIIPEAIFNIPPKEMLNIHPSLLPKFRGSTPIQTSLLLGKETGVTIIKIDREVDHGPIIAQKEVTFSEWPIPYPEAEKKLAQAGAELLSEILPDWINGNVRATEQDHTKATFTKKIEKKDGEISLDENPDILYRKFCAYYPWPGLYFFVHQNDKKIRVNVKDASLVHGEFKIVKVVPEGKKEMLFEEFKRGYRS